MSAQDMPLSVFESCCPACSSSAIGESRLASFLWACSECGLVFDNPRPSVDSISRHYNSETQYDEWLQHLDDRERLWQRRLKKMGEFSRAGSLLDVGTGIGQFLNQARHTYSPVAGTEISKTAIAIAEQRYGLEIARGDIESIDTSDTFDNITVFHVLEHVHDPGAFLRKCLDLLKPGGYLFIAVPNELESVHARRQKLKGKNLLKPLSCNPAEIHLSHFTSRSLSAVLRRCGFRVVDGSLDPYWVTPQERELRAKGFYLICSMIQRLTRVNLYPCIWAVASRE